jgi:putative membrane protein
MKRFRRIITALVVLAAIFVGVLFALQNREPVALDLLVYTFAPRSLALWVLTAFALGGIAGIAVSSAILLRGRATLANCRRQLAKARKELDQQRTAPTPAGD